MNKYGRTTPAEQVEQEPLPSCSLEQPKATGRPSPLSTT